MDPKVTAQRMRNAKAAKAAKRVSPDAPELTPFEGFFVEAYILNGGNATRAYRTARGGGPSSVKDSTCAVEGCKLLRLPKVRTALEARRQERFQDQRPVADEGFIPACAGKTRQLRDRRGTRWVHPRG